MIRVVLVDDHTLVRQGLCALLSAEGDIQVVGEAADGREAVRLVSELRPHVAVMDIAMPRLNGLVAVRQLRELAPEVKVVILSAHHDPEYVAHAQALGVEDYLSKDSSLAELANVIRRVALGNDSERGAPVASSASAAPALTVRETEVLQLIAEGRANKQTALDLGIAIKTVEKHRQSLMRKLDIHDVAGLTRYAIARGLVEGRDGGVDP